ncbi:hypothetical protein [Actinoplanes sp. NPDC051411]|uniref:hypothetical protein n=1 Tax=Actinoplanes sp. NPDC051411 TaxID=3155522 RepID=UPI00343FFEB9
MPTWKRGGAPINLTPSAKPATRRTGSTGGEAIGYHPRDDACARSDIEPEADDGDGR